MAKIINLFRILLLVVASQVLILHTTEAAEHVIQWIIPETSEVASYYPNSVANITFRVNDVLVFNFTTGFHNVATLQKKKDFNDCNTSVNSEIISSGPAKITLDRAGEYYFACLFPSHCSLGQKLSINVTSSGSSPSPHSPSHSPSPSPSPASPMSVTSTLSFLLMVISINVLF